MYNYKNTLNILYNYKKHTKQYVQLQKHTKQYVQLQKHTKHYVQLQKQTKQYVQFFTYTVMSCLSKLGTGVANSDVLMDGQKNRHWYFYFYVKHLQADGTTNAILHLLITYHDILEQLQLVHNTLLGLCNHCSDIDVLNVFLFPKGAVIVSVVHTKFDLCLFSCWRKPFLIRTVSVVCRFSSYFSKRLSNRHFFVGRSFFSFF